MMKKWENNFPLYRENLQDSQTIASLSINTSISRTWSWGSVIAARWQIIEPIGMMKKWEQYFQLSKEHLQNSQTTASLHITTAHGLDPEGE